VVQGVVSPTETVDVTSLQDVLAGQGRVGRRREPRHRTAGPADEGGGGNLGDPERNPGHGAGARRHPQAAQGWAETGSREFDPVESQRVPLAGHSVSTGAACPRESTMSVGGRCQPNWHCRSAGVAAPDPPWRDTREQAYVPAEQPSPSQGARLPPPHAHPGGSQHPRLASPQGPQEPGRLRPGLLQADHTSCCPRFIGCGTPTPFAPRLAGDGDRGRGPWSSISPPETMATPVATPLEWGSW
jgi:hypothetical protein